MRKYNLPTPSEKTCKKCEVTFPIEGFPKYQKCPQGRIYYRSYCHVCWKRFRQPYHGKYRDVHRARLVQMDRDKYAKHKKSILERSRRHYNKLKTQVFDHYGWRCDCCGETEPCFLTLDHVNNDGAAHRKENGIGNILYRWIIDNGFPPSVRVLCFNCNSGRYRNNGICPHQSNDRRLPRPITAPDRSQ